MALLVWLPLNGTFENKGILDITLTASGSAIFATGGKISELALQGNGSTYWSINPITLGSEASICCWSKTTTNGKMMWVIEATSSTVLNLYTNTIYSLNTGDGNNNPFVDDDGNNVTRFIDDKWHHFVVTFGNNQAKLYIDGEYKGKARAFKNPTTTTSKKIKIGGGYNGGHGYDWNGMINDFRIYNHCLSSLEIKEIALGLILHYKMDDNSNTNWLLPNLEKTVTRASSNTFIDYPYYSDLISHDETEYTVDFYAKGSTSNIKMDVYFRNSSGSSYALTTTQTVTTNWKHYSLPLSGSPNALQIFRARCYSGTAGSILYIKDMKLFSNHMPIRSSIITDSSGYSHHGTIVGNVLTVIDNKSKYNKCIYVPSADDYIIRDGLNGEIHTIACWAYIPNDANNHIIFADNNSKIIIGLSASNTLAVHQKYSSKIALYWNRSNLRGKWSHFAVTVDNYVYELYINGEKQTKGNTGDGWNSNSTNKLYLGRRYYTSGSTDYRYSLMGNISDFRVYATILDDNAIKNLYNISMKIDNLNNIHTFEYKEQDNANIKLYKTGLLLTDEINEISGNTLFKKTGQIYAPEFIER